MRSRSLETSESRIEEREDAKAEEPERNGTDRHSSERVIDEGSQRLIDALCLSGICCRSCCDKVDAEECDEGSSGQIAEPAQNPDHSLPWTRDALQSEIVLVTVHEPPGRQTHARRHKDSTDHFDRHGPTGPPHDLCYPGLRIARGAATRGMTGNEFDRADAEYPVDDPGHERRDAFHGSIRSGDAIEHPPRRVAAQSHRQKDKEQLASGASPQLLQSSRTTCLGRCTPVPCDVESEIGEKQIDDTPRRDSDPSDRAQPARCVPLGDALDSNASRP